MYLSVEKRRIRRSAVDESEAHEKDVPREFRIFDKKKGFMDTFLKNLRLYLHLYTNRLHLTPFQTNASSSIVA
jgi:hypothetical protein